MAKLHKLTALITAIAIVIVVFFSALFIAENSEHKCSGVDCQICEQVQLKLRLFNNQTPKPEDSLIILAVVWCVVLTLGYKTNIISSKSLIELKTKLSN